MDKYKKNSRAVIDYMRAKGNGKYVIGEYDKCFNSFGDYLRNRKLDYSMETSKDWLQSISTKVNKTSHDLYAAALWKLDDVYTHKEIRDSHYDPQKTQWGKLSEDFQNAIMRMLENEAGKSNVTKANIKNRCCTILYLLESERNRHAVEEICYEDLFFLEEHFQSRSYYARTGNHYYLQKLLSSLYREGKCSYGLSLFVPLSSHEVGLYWNRMDKVRLAELTIRQQNSTSSVCLGDYLALCDDLAMQYEDSCHSRTSKLGLARITNRFYLFMDVHSLDYSPEVGKAWLESIRPVLTTQEHKHHRRIIELLERNFIGNTEAVNTVFRYRVSVFDRIPEWCKPPVLGYIGIRKAEGLTSTSIGMIKSSVCRFCSYIGSIGVNSFSELTPQHIKNFNLQDKHDTIEGKNAYNSRIRAFLKHLGEAGMLSNPFLFLSMPMNGKKRGTIVVTLSEDERAELDGLLGEGGILSLRDKAVIQIGLRMGLRGVDIANLAIDSIDWKEETVTFSQTKTKQELRLPMPVTVANAIYKYIMEERPDCCSRNIFITSKAPYKKIGSGACYAALIRALPDRKVRGSGFHVTRKTFATAMLRNGAKINDVTNALGHRDFCNVHKYISLDEERMRLCGLGLKVKGLQLEGGFCNV
jgi:site-specific recombinase XerD